MRLAINKFLAVLSWDFRLQYRYYFWTVGLIVTGVWVLLLSALTEEASAQIIPALIFADIGQIGLIFIAGMCGAMPQTRPIGESAWTMHCANGM